MLLVLGVAFLCASILPPLLRRLPISLPMLYVTAGVLLPWLWPGLSQAPITEHQDWIEPLTEIAVIFSLLGAGLKLDRKINWKHWSSTWRLLLVTMPFCILLLTFGGVWLGGLGVASSLLLAAALAPTDPVLASQVQVSAPGEGDEHEVRFALTSEAGLNDGMAFPFVHLALTLAATGMALGDLTYWLAVDLLWQIIVAVLVGIVVGRCVAIVVFRLAPSTPIADGFVAIALTLIAYSCAQIVHSYGFIAVFVAALAFRRYEHDHEYHKTLHDFMEQIERLFVALLLIFLGIAISMGLLAHLTWQMTLLGVLFLFIIRPMAGWVGLLGTKLPQRERLAVAVLGIRGAGTFYYLAYGLNHSNFSEATRLKLWSAAALVILLSIFIHGMVTPWIVHTTTKPQTSSGDDLAHT